MHSDGGLQAKVSSAAPGHSQLSLQYFLYCPTNFHLRSLQEIFDIQNRQKRDFRKPAPSRQEWKTHHRGRLWAEKNSPAPLRRDDALLDVLRNNGADGGDDSRCY